MRLETRNMRLNHLLHGVSHTTPDMENVTEESV
jgi:hypothetical protein